MSHIKIKLNDEQVAQLKDVCKQFNNDEGELINVLHKAQSIFGYLPAEVQEVIAHELNISLAKVYGVVSFYSFFTMKPKGQHPISICLGTACYVRGATVLKWKKLAKNWGGSCFGFVQTSYMVWDSIQLFKEFFPKTGPWISDKLYDLPLNEHNRKSINYMMVSQMRKQLLTYYTALWGKGPVYTLQQTKKMMSDTTSNDYRGIAMWNTNGPGGHIVNPYKILIDSIDQNIEYIYVYDNNMPNDTTRKITIKKNEYQH
jgi:hypothetical protein